MQLNTDPMRNMRKIMKNVSNATVVWQFARLMLLINKEMVNLRIDNKEIEVPAGTSLIEAARQNGVYIPSLCYNSDLPHYSSCMVCAVRDIKANTMGIGIVFSLDAILRYMNVPIHVAKK